MVDNVTTNTGTGGAVIKTDDDGTAHWQEVKIAHGADGTQTRVTAAAGLPVAPDSGGFEVSLSATDNAVLDTIDAAIDAINDKLVTGTVIGDVNLGAADSAVLVTIDAVLDLINAKLVTGTVIGDVNLGATDAAVLVTIDAAIDAMSAKFASGTVIGDVNLGATDNAVLDSIAAAVATEGSALGSGILLQGDDGTDRTNVLVDTAGHLQVDIVTIPTVNTNSTVLGADAENAAAVYNPVQVAGRYDATPRALDDGDVGALALDADGAVHISDGGNAITIDGTVSLSATDNTVLDNIQTSVDTVAAAVSTQMQVDIVGALPAGTAAIGKLAPNTGVDIGDVDVTSISAGSNLIGDVGLGVRTSGGIPIDSCYYDNDLDETAIAAKASAGQLYFIQVINLHTAPLYLQLFNVASGSVTVGTTVPDLQFVIPSQGDANGAGFVLPLPVPIEFDVAITVAATTDSQGSGAPGANVCHAILGIN